jgi:hypothetical protein
LYVQNTDLNDCEHLDNGDVYLGEGWGVDANNNRVCEVMAINGTAMTMCPTTAVHHFAWISTRQSAAADLGLLTGIMALPSAEQTSWTTSSSSVQYSIPKSTYCPAGQTISASSIGTDTATP